MGADALVLGLKLIICIPWRLALGFKQDGWVRKAVQIHWETCCAIANSQTLHSLGALPTRNWLLKIGCVVTQIFHRVISNIPVAPDAPGPWEGSL